MLSIQQLSITDYDVFPLRRISKNDYSQFFLFSLFLFFSIVVLRVFWRVADVGVPDVHHVRPGDAASWPAPAPGPYPASTVPVLHPELP